MLTYLLCVFIVDPADNRRLIAISLAHRDTRRHPMYDSMAVQVPTVPSARARGASMHSMSLIVVDIVAQRLSKASL